MSSRVITALVPLIGCRGADPPTFGAMPDDMEDTVPAAVDASGVIPCDDPIPAGAGHLTLATDRIAPDDPDRDNPQSDGGDTAEWGAAVLDADGDGRLDLYVPFAGGGQLLIAAEDGTWTDEGSTRLPPLTVAQPMGAVPVDVNGDGAMDLVVSAVGPDVLLLNDGAGYFEDATEALGFDTGDGNVFATAWGDYDRDGDLDCLVPTAPHGPATAEEFATGQFLPGDPARLLENRGEEGFVDRTELLPAEVNDGHPFIGSWQDVDGDGTAEILIFNNHGAFYRSNQVWQWQGGRFVDITEAIGLDFGTDAMGVGIADISGDRLPDFLVTGWGELLLIESLPDGTWADTARSRGLTPTHEDSVVAWGAELVDMDNDGLLDAVVVYGTLENFPVGATIEPPALQPDALFLRQPDGSFAEVAEAWGVDDDGIGHGVVVADLNGDGWLDLVKREVFGDTPVYLSDCGTESWLTLSLRQDGANPFAVGARVTLWAEGARQVRWLRSGGTGLAGGSQPIAHFGLGEAEHIERIEVRWPDGARSEVSDITPRQQLTITRP